MEFHGFKKGELTLLKDMLNVHLCTTKVLAARVQDFHWNTEGSNFIELHRYYDELYALLNTVGDELAERIRQFEQRPASTLKEFCLGSAIEELDSSDLGEKQMVIKLVEGFGALIGNLRIDMNKFQTGEFTDLVTQDLLIKTIGSLEKELWFLKSLTK